MYVRSVGVCVCVWNIWTDVKLLIRIVTAGVHRDAHCGYLCTNEAIRTVWEASCDHRWGRSSTSPANFCDISVFWEWRPAKPKTGSLVFCYLHGLPQSALWYTLFVFFEFELQSISEFKASTTIDGLFRLLVMYSTFHTYILRIPMITSKRTPWYLRLVWLCLHGIQFPTDPMMDHFLSSVISMVAPTRCHGPIGGNPVWGDCRLTWLQNLHFSIW